MIVLDENIPESQRPTFFTREQGFYSRELRHPRYSLVILVVGRDEVASFVQRFLRHPDFQTRAKRLGAVVRVSSADIRGWRLGGQKEEFLPWG